MDMYTIKTGMLVVEQTVLKCSGGSIGRLPLLKNKPTGWRAPKDRDPGP